MPVLRSACYQLNFGIRNWLYLAEFLLTLIGIWCGLLWPASRAVSRCSVTNVVALKRTSLLCDWRCCSVTDVVLCDWRRALWLTSLLCDWRCCSVTWRRALWLILLLNCLALAVVTLSCYSWRYWRRNTKTRCLAYAKNWRESERWTRHCRPGFKVSTVVVALWWSYCL